MIRDSVSISALRFVASAASAGRALGSFVQRFGLRVVCDVANRCIGCRAAASREAAAQAADGEAHRSRRRGGRAHCLASPFERNPSMERASKARISQAGDMRRGRFTRKGILALVCLATWLGHKAPVNTSGFNDKPRCSALCCTGVRQQVNVASEDFGRLDAACKKWSVGDRVLSLPLDGGGSLRIANHEASADEGSPVRTHAIAKQALRVMQPNPAKGPSLIQAFVKLCRKPGEPSNVRFRAFCLPCSYSTTLVSMAMAALVAAPNSGDLSGLKGVTCVAMVAQLRILCIGWKGVSIPSSFAGVFSNSVVVGAEIESAVGVPAREATGFSPASRLRTFVGDGALFALRVVDTARETGKDSPGPYGVSAVDARSAFDGAA